MLTFQCEVLRSVQTRIAYLAHGWPVGYRALRYVRLFIGARLPARRLTGIPGRVHWNDLMLVEFGQEAITSYDTTGRHAARFIVACDARHMVGLDIQPASHAPSRQSLFEQNAIPHIETSTYLPNVASRS